MAQDEPHGSTSPSPSLVRRGIFEGGTEYTEREHGGQVKVYLKLTGLKRGLLMNFKVERLVDGIKRVSL